MPPPDSGFLYCWAFDQKDLFGDGQTGADVVAQVLAEVPQVGLDAVLVGGGILRATGASCVSVASLSCSTATG